VGLLCVCLDPVHYMILLGSKYDRNMIREVVIHRVGGLSGAGLFGDYGVDFFFYVF
jgi:hypothetical protein